ncbi:MAG TPA: putative zinc-binding protein [Methanomassiliicoccales archaeon]|nr:putative zinc-binding protein [Methanomassiliicoccales archaeon]HQM67400.1 putative zinc-binding protein [Methanomassiliicoccales archaeon]
MGQTSTIDVVICSGFSPGARVLRAAVRELADEEDIRVVTVAPALAGIPKAVAEMRALQDHKVVCVDGCEGGCGLQVLNRFEVLPSSIVMIEKHFNVTRKGIDEAKDRIRQAVREVQG